MRLRTALALALVGDLAIVFFLLVERWELGLFALIVSGMGACAWFLFVDRWTLKKRIVLPILFLLFLMLLAGDQWLWSGHFNRRSFNEGNALSAIREIHEGEREHLRKFGKPATLLELEKAGILREGTERRIRKKFQYRIAVTVTGGGFEIRAVPLVPGASGYRSFFIDQTGAIHFNASGPANRSHPTIP